MTQDPRALASCPNCHGNGLLVRRSGDHAEATPCPCRGNCTGCSGTGFARSEEGLSRCDCAEWDRRAVLLDRMGLPARHALSTLSSFRDKTRDQTALKGALSGYLRDAPERLLDGRGIVLHGDVGRGKTHLLCALCRELVLQRGIAVRFVEFSHLMSDLKAGFDQGQSAARLLEPLIQVDVLAIDELGKGRSTPTPFEEMVVDELVSRRYAAVRPILATTNYSLPSRSSFVGNAATSNSLGDVGARVAADLAPPSWPSLAERVGDRVVSRLLEMCTMLGVTGEDWRLAQGAPPRRGRAG